MREVETVKERGIDDLVPSKGCGTPAEENEWDVRCTERPGKN